jgi:hypothetical protein
LFLLQCSASYKKIGACVGLNFLELGHKKNE